MAQRREILCMAIAYNLTRLALLEGERDVQADFAERLEPLQEPLYSKVVIHETAG